jgi:hypothetical protein
MVEHWNEPHKRRSTKYYPGGTMIPILECSDQVAHRHGCKVKTLQPIDEG